VRGAHRRRERMARFDIRGGRETYVSNLTTSACPPINLKFFRNRRTVSVEILPGNPESSTLLPPSVIPPWLPFPETMERSEASSRPFSPRERILGSEGARVVRGVNGCPKNLSCLSAAKAFGRTDDWVSVRKARPVGSNR
jgi:hypothetical protein